MNPRNDKRKNEVLQCICDYSADNGYSPSYSYIADVLGCSRPLVAKYVARLLSEGRLFRDREGRIRPAEPFSRADMMAIIGEVACGKPILAAEDIEGYVYIDRRELGEGEFFGLRAKGYSMIEAGISDGDLVYIRRQETARDGQIVVAIIDSEEGDGSFATLKRFYRNEEDRCFILRPENREMSDITVPFDTPIRIVGVATRVMKRLEE